MSITIEFNAGGVPVVLRNNVEVKLACKIFIFRGLWVSSSVGNGTLLEKGGKVHLYTSDGNTVQIEA